MAANVTWTDPKSPAEDWGDLSRLGTSTVDPMEAYKRQLDEQAQVNGHADDMVTELPEPEPPSDVDLLPLHPFVPLESISTDPPPPLLVERLDPEGHTILYGTGGSGKGALSCYWIALMVRSGLTVLVLDYEDHGPEWSRRIAALAPDAHASGRVFWYRPRRPLWQEAADLAAWTADAGVNYVVVDSAVMGCLGSDPLSPEAAAQYAAGVADMGRPVLSLAHVTKMDDGRYPFGSVFWHNLSRTTWSLQPDKSGGAVLTHRKHNNYAALGRFLVTATWHDGRLMEVWEKGYSASLADRASELLMDGELGLDAILEALNDTDDEGQPVKRDTLKRALNRGIPERFRLNGGKYSRA